MNLSLIIAILATGLVVGGAARFAIPGPDPMPIWLTIAIGLVGALVGAGVTDAAGGGRYLGFVAFLVAMALVAAYRHFVQRRPVFGRGALKFPERGLGVDQYRERLRRLGIDPDKLAPDPAELRRAQSLAALDHLHKTGVLDDDEYAAKKAALDGPTTNP
jgi:uncharacterized membrane protein YeaQ/YmgE (transglycosylase-associated protein family)